MAAFFALALLITALRGTSWTAPSDPNLGAGDYAIVQVAHGTAGAVAAKATAAGATDVAALDKLDIVTARVSGDSLRSLQNDPRVSFIATDAVITAAGKDEHFERTNGRPSPGVSAVDANQAWSGATGRGVTVALMDTGIARHPDLEGSVIARMDFVNDGATLLDPSGHGTFVAGLIAAHGETFKGVAPDAKLVSLRVLDQKGNGTMHSVLAAFDWLLQNRTSMNIKVLNLSFGAPQRSSYHRELLAGVVESAWFAGITVIAAAGNDGPATGTVSMPGADPFVVTVGSFADQGTLATNDDRESVFSSRGPTRDGFAKPDVLAPGEHVVSLRVPGTALDRDVAKDLAAGPYARLSGTSASTAMVAGAAADILEAHRSYSATQVKGAVIASGRRIVGTRTPGLDVDDSLTVRPARVNAGVLPSFVLLRLLAQSGNVFGPGIAWDGISWEGISWESVSWEGVAWEAVSWEGVTWDSVTWELR
ncbi:MAG TPA: S8 family peptidase [Candidatus Limnocylindria bacterium]|nr:S8 family peptidase [Candidatus Limnocylindria bacterium]